MNRFHVQNQFAQRFVLISWSASWAPWQNSSVSRYIWRGIKASTITSTPNNSFLPSTLGSIAVIEMLDRVAIPLLCLLSGPYILQSRVSSFFVFPCFLQMDCSIFQEITGTRLLTDQISYSLSLLVHCRDCYRIKPVWRTTSNGRGDWRGTDDWFAKSWVRVTITAAEVRE